MARFHASFRFGLVARKIETRIGRGQRAAAQRVHDHHLWLIRHPQPASRPGEPPHRKTDEMFNAHFWEYDPAVKIAIVGNTSDHALYTEFGLSYEPRPWFRVGFIDQADEVARIWAAAFR